MRSRRSSITARILAPLALIAAGLAVWMVVQGGGIDGKDDSASATTTVKVKKKIPSKYTVKRGDVLSAISVKYGVSVQHLRDLNDDLDASALRAGQVIRLRH